MVERGKDRGVRGDPKTGKPIEVPEAGHFYRCKVCGALLDCRDLGQVFDHEPGGSHPKADHPQQSLLEPKLVRSGSAATVGAGATTRSRTLRGLLLPARKVEHW